MSTLSFATSIYHPDAVKEAIEAFADFATLSLEEREEELVVSASEVDESVAAVFADEFCNYALHASIVKARQ